MIAQARFISLFRRELDVLKDYRKLITAMAVSAISNILVLVVINKAANTAEYGKLNFVLFVMFASMVILFSISQRYVLARITQISEEVMNRIRVRIADKVRRADLYKIEKLGNAGIYSRITKDSVTITQTAPLIVNAMQSALMVSLGMVYVAMLSVKAFILTCVSLIAIVLYFIYNDRIISSYMREAAEEEMNLFDRISHVLFGFKEIKMNRRKSDDVLSDLNHVSNMVQVSKINAMVPFTNNYTMSLTFFYAVIAMIVFVLPNLSQTFSDTVVQLTMAMLFLLGPLTNVVNMASLLSQSNIAVENLEQMESNLDDASEQLPDDGIEEETRFCEFKTIELNNVVFHYLDSAGNTTFTLGPLSMQINRGETIFITGGNGSGKSSLLKVLTSLYHSQLGEILVDGEAIQRESLQSYRELFTAIFSDFHLFDRLYGMEDVDTKKVRELIKYMQLTHKTDFKDQRFTNLDLSTGQRKRLAMITSLLDDREILVFDEWAADQDAHFRSFYYEELLKDLKDKGKTIIAVTHDERFFHCADRVINLELGQLTN